MVSTSSKSSVATVSSTHQREVDLSVTASSRSSTVAASVPGDGDVGSATRWRLCGFAVFGRERRAAAAGPLADVHADVGRGDEAPGVGGVGREQGDADAGGGGELHPGQG